LGKGVVHFANEMLKDRNDSLANKRCLILGSGKIARSVASTLLQFGAIPLTLSDASGHIYEPDGIDEAKLRTISKIKSERGALLGRYIIASTTAKFNDPERIVDIPCDLCFPCASMNELTDSLVNSLADKGCSGIVEGGFSTVTPEARKILKKRGLMYGPHILTMTGTAIQQSSIMSALRSPMSLDSTGISSPNSSMMGLEDKLFADEVSRIHSDVKATAQEFNSRGDLFAGANILGFLRVANAMMNQGIF
jgi:glutamate dehydrogenase (NADP+)